MILKRIPLILLCLGLSTITPVHAAPQGDMAPSDKQLAELYWQGQESLKKSEWSTARDRFRRLETELRSKEPGSADAAVYWQAYALVQARRTAEARKVLDQFDREFSESRWRRDADDLRRQIEGSTVATTVASEGDDDLAEIAVSGLMQAPPERALPILRKVLQGGHSIKVKKRALFVLSQLDEDEALRALGDIAAHSTDLELREEAIRMLGVSGENAAVEQLSAIYASNARVDDRKAIIQAWLIADRPDLVMNAARTETDADLRRSAIHALGAMEATAELKTLFASEKSPDLRSEIVQSLGVAEDSKTLTEIAASGESEAIRIEAIQALGVAGDADADAALVRIYSSADSPKIREAALSGLLISDNSDAMLELYRKAKSKEEKQTLLRMLTLTDSDATLDLIEAELDKGGKQP
jgi:HEAT repeat protein